MVVALYSVFGTVPLLIMTKPPLLSVFLSPLFWLSDFTNVLTGPSTWVTEL